MDRRLKSLLSLCQKAGKLVSGEALCENALKAQLARLVIISEEASDNTKKKFINKSFFYKIDCFVYGMRVELNAAIGKENRSTIVITDDNFANKIRALIKVEEEQ
ncbi:MAG: ribosomal L7Ae/L30e/S12e/Gadd45 family protein [Clostridiales bacterium]|jgi:ribosomal protein L7Ae-like RNA K-turn-binding protein|nr:ribosomal L7Ae/L30e/S12e/Gadd45 family protein [Clostridiales bacterium]